jgi:hypothetical protein
LPLALGILPMAPDPPRTSPYRLLMG